MKNAANVSRIIHRMDLSRIEKKLPPKLGRFILVIMEIMSPENPVLGMEITASSFKLRANASEGRKAISYQLVVGGLYEIAVKHLLGSNYLP